MSIESAHHTIVAFDVAGSGSRDTQLILKMREDLRRILSKVLAKQGIDVSTLHVEDLGDGLRVAIPARMSATELLRPFVANLDAELREHRKGAAPAAQLRLRVVVHHGLVFRDGDVWAGAAMQAAARLLDAAPVRQALNSALKANFVLVVSESIYDEVVKHGFGPDPDAFRRVPIAEKETRTTAWIHVPGVHLPSHEELPGPSPAQRRPLVFFGVMVAVFLVSAGTWTVIQSRQEGTATDPNSVAPSVPTSGVCATAAMSPQTRVPPIPGRVAQPASGDKVPQHMIVAGTIGKVPAGHSVWTTTEVVGPPGHVFWEKFKIASCRIWPGPRPATVGEDGGWTATVAFGGGQSEHAGLRFRLSLVIADPAATAQFIEYNKRAGPDFSGLETKILTGTRALAATVEVERA